MKKQDDSIKDKVTVPSTIQTRHKAVQTTVAGVFILGSGVAASAARVVKGAAGVVGVSSAVDFAVRASVARAEAGAAGTSGLPSVDVDM